MQQHFLGTYCASGAVLGMEDAMMQEAEKSQAEDAELSRLALDWSSLQPVELWWNSVPCLTP